MSFRSKASKSLCLLLVLMLALSLAACGGSTTQSSDKTTQSTNTAQQTTEPPKPELYTIKVIANTTVVKSSDETEIGKIIKDKFGIVLEYMPYSGDYREKLGLMLAAGDYPELLRIERDDLVQKYISAGALVQLDDFIKDAPNFTERFKNQLPYWRSASPDGKLYKWEINTPTETFGSGLDVMVRTDALEKQGWPKLLSEDDYFNFLQKAMKDIPQSNGKKTIGMTMPLAEGWGMAGILPIMYEKGDTYSATAGNAGVIYNWKEQKYEGYMTNKYVKEAFKFFNRLYLNGILDKEAFTDKYDQLLAKVNNGIPISVWYCAWTATDANNALIKAGHPEMQYIRLPIQSNTMVKEGQKRIMMVDSSRPFDSVVITKNAKDPARLFKLVDYFASEEGQILLQSGIEGRDYVIKDGKRVPTDTIIQVSQGKYPDPNYREKEGMPLLGGADYSSFILFSKCQQNAKDGLSYDLVNDSTYADQITLTDRQKEAYQKLGWANSSEWWTKNGIATPSGLVAAVSVDPTSDFGKTEAKMTDLRVKMSPKLIVAKNDAEFEAVYQDIIEQYNKLNPQSVIDNYNALIKEKMEKIK